MKVVSVEAAKSQYSPGDTVYIVATVERGLESGGWVDLYIASNRNQKWSKVADEYVGDTGILPNLMGIGAQKTVRFTVAIPRDVDDATFTIGAVARGSDTQFVAANTDSFEVVGKTVTSLNYGTVRFKSSISGVSGAVVYVDGIAAGQFDVAGITDYMKISVGTHTVQVVGENVYSDIASFAIESGIKRIQTVAMKTGTPGLLSGVDNTTLYAVTGGAVVGILLCVYMLSGNSNNSNNNRYGV
jgi:hypothetical protein